MNLKAIGSRFGVLMIRAYQVTLSAWLGGRCRFYPSCSEYAIEAFQAHGWWKGLWLAIRRLCRCHPFNAGGVDLVPPKTCACEHIRSWRP
ncbi:MAG TPA: membrane protein insertion efficiency factor YidD [Kiritimatiellia bacterium]|nr:membrane protein insertion efficiency factor YidD [Kiritimatiellia bacterium]